MIITLKNDFHSTDAPLRPKSYKHITAYYPYAYRVSAYQIRRLRRRLCGDIHMDGVFLALDYSGGGWIHSRQPLHD